ncbi:beta-glucosidase H [Nocardioides sp. URHA0020]|uniref:beta-glucosidase H n=1 Tax=Nocardioides sp. URHA0020 TaxID=1380392 RepID=UPI00048DD139|nr:glycoside hydrolase family 3 C-terminal domain-containing protein [Nocardioides sp. URHA0020]
MRRTSRTIATCLAGAIAITLPVPAHAATDHHPDQRSRFTGPRSEPPRVAPDHRLLPVTRWDRSPAVERRVNALLAQMTTEEKADLATGELNNNFGFYNNPIPRLGIPAQTMADGPIGVRVANPAVDRRTTQLPSGSSLAASFDTSLARRYGVVLGRESLRTGHNVLLGPTLDITRTPLWGRSFEGFGEDPLVSGLTGSQVALGIQDYPVIATLKHPFAYNQETDRFDVDARVSERALQEIYLRPFGIAQRKAHPGAMMCSFNQINGAHACESPLMNTLLKQQLRFRGFVMSDYNATPSTVQAANNGLDQEQPGDQGPGSANFGERLVAAVQAGDVSMARLNDMARRILRPMIGLGLLDTPATVGPWPKKADDTTARTIAARGMVLLKNAEKVLPLRRNGRSIAVIGPDADNISAQGGGSSQNTFPTASVSPLEGIRAAARGSQVTYSPGVDGISEGDLLPGPAPVPSTVLSPAAGSREDGLTAQYWSNASFSGEPHLSQVDPNANVNFGFQNFPGFNAASPKIPTVRGDFALLGDLSARWTGVFTAPRAATYTLGLTARGDATLYVNGTRFVQHTGALSSVSKQIRLRKNQELDIRIDYSAAAASSYQGGQVRFFWRHPDSVTTPKIDAAVAAARRARTAVVVVRDYETEGYDRPSLVLPKEQEQLIRKVAAVNPRTVVVVETGTVSRVSPWIGRVEGAIQAWYPGQRQGNAIADVMFGRVNPSGHLPATIPQSDRQVPKIGTGVTRFTEGVFVGYRGYLRSGARPSFAFGHGLSYTRFRFDRLSARLAAGANPDILVRLRLRNVGDRTGRAVPQIYLGRLPGGPATPTRQLAGYRSVPLRAGASRVVTIRVPREAASYWDSQRDRWVTPHGRLRVVVGHRVTDVADSTTVRVTR